MSRKTVAASAVVLAILCLAVGLLAGGAKAQPPREMGGGDMPRRFVTNDVTLLWVHLCFGMKIANDQMVELRPVFQSEIDGRNKLAEKIDSDGLQEVRQELMQARRAFVEKIREQLTQEQQVELDEWLSELAGRLPAGGERRPAGAAPGRDSLDRPMAR